MKNNPTQKREEKKCSSCKQIKDIRDFSKNRTGTNGFSWYCRGCHSLANKKWRDKNREKAGEYGLKSYNREKRLGIRSARNKYSWDLRQGRIKKKACVVCGSSESEGHHHFGFEFPLEVVWLCKVHHGRHHKHLRRLIQDSVSEERERVLEWVRKMKTTETRAGFYDCGEHNSISECCRNKTVDDILNTLTKNEI